MALYSNHTIFTYVLANGNEMSGRGKVTLDKIKEVIRNSPSGEVVPVFWENTSQHRKPGRVGTMYFKAGTKGPLRVPDWKRVKKWTYLPTESL